MSKRKVRQIGDPRLTTPGEKRIVKKWLRRLRRRAERADPENAGRRTRDFTWDYTD